MNLWVRRARWLPLTLPALLLVAMGFVVGSVVVAAVGAVDTSKAQTTAFGGGCLPRVLQTIRTIESGGHYELPPNKGGASGAYQFIDSTWRAQAQRAGVDAGLYPQAWTAPAAVQDQVAGFGVQAFLADQANSVDDVPVYWYIGHPIRGPSDEWDTVPMPEAGNVLTPRQYQQRWLTVFKGLGGCDTAAYRPADPVALNVPEPGFEQYANGELPTALLVEVQAGKMLAPRAAASWLYLARHAQADGIYLTITSGYRSAEYQQKLLDALGNISEGGLAMVPGTSPHGLGIAADMDVLNPKVLGWLRHNGPSLCWVNAAPAREPWHWQHVADCTPRD